MVKRLGLVAVVVAVMLSVAATPARAALILDFSNGVAGAGGTITQTGSNYIGSGILIDVLTVDPLGANTQYNVDGTATGRTGSAGVLAFNTATGAFSITGSIPGLGVTLQTLLNGVISSFSVVSVPSTNNIVFNADGYDSKAASLLIALGINPNTPFAFGGFSIAATPAGAPGHFTAFSTDVTNTAIPEPATMMLLGTGLLAVAGATRRRLRNPRA